MIGFTQSNTSAHTTDIWFGTDHVELNFCIYTVAGFANCLLLAGAVLLAGRFMRKRKPTSFS